MTEPLFQRETEPCPAVALRVGVNDLDDLKSWLESRAKEEKEHRLRWLLAHAEDGVIWGELRSEGLVTAHDVLSNEQRAQLAAPALRAEFLWQARLFGEKAELLLWRDGERAWQARIIRDLQPGGDFDANDMIEQYAEAFDEPQMLWGTEMEPVGKTAFTIMSDGVQGLRHIVPLDVQEWVGEDKRHLRPLRLRARHYLSQSEDGFVRVAASRLVDLYDQRAKARNSNG